MDKNAPKHPPARGLGWTDKQWDAFVKSGYDESLPVKPDVETPRRKK